MVNKRRITRNSGSVGGGGAVRTSISDSIIQVTTTTSTLVECQDGQEFHDLEEEGELDDTKEV